MYFNGETPQEETKAPQIIANEQISLDQFGFKEQFMN